MNFGTCWEMFGHALEAFSDGFGIVLGKSKKMSTNKSLQMCLGVFFQHRAARNNHF